MRTISTSVLVSALLLLLLPSAAGAQPSPSVAPGRVAELDGELLLLPAGWDEWRAAERNSAVGEGDWLRTGRSAGASLELAPSVLVRLDSSSELRVDRRQGVLVLELLEGRLAACSSQAAEGLSVVTPEGTVWLEPGGFYRVESARGRTNVDVSAGLAEAEIGGTVRSVRPGRSALLERGEARPRLSRMGDSGWDALDRAAHRACLEHVGSNSELGLVGAASLQGHGDWVHVDGRRYWRPRSVGHDWRPFGDGCFRWHPGWGWYFVSNHPWGWVTHHHGGWIWTARHGWVWYPDSYWRPHTASFWIVDRTVYWCPRDRGDRDRGRGGDRDEARDRDRGWSSAPLEEFGARPIVRARHPVGGGELPRLSPRGDEPARDDLRGPIDREVLPPLPPRAREPLLGGRPELPVRPPLRGLNVLERPVETRPVPPRASLPAAGEPPPAPPALRRDPVVRVPSSPRSPARPELGAGAPDAPRAPAAPELSSRTPRGPEAPPAGRVRPPAPPMPAPEAPRLERPVRPELPSPRIRPTPGTLRERERDLRRSETPPGFERREVPPRELPRVERPPAPVRPPPPAPAPRVEPAPERPVPPPAPAPRVQRPVRKPPPPAPPPPPQGGGTSGRGDEERRKR